MELLHLTLSCIFPSSPPSLKALLQRQLHHCIVCNMTKGVTNGDRRIFNLHIDIDETLFCIAGLTLLARTVVEHVAVVVDARSPQI